MTARALLLAVLALAIPFASSAQAPPPPTPTTAVLVKLTIKADADRAAVMKTLPEEVRATVKLHLDGKIGQWYGRSDGRGVVFVLNATSVADAKAAIETLPLSKANLADFDYTPLGPLTPLRLLLAPAQNDR